MTSPVVRAIADASSKKPTSPDISISEIPIYGHADASKSSKMGRPMGLRVRKKKLTNSSIANFIESPEAFLRDSIEGLSDDDHR